MRRADFGTLSGPEFTLRDLPRITVRGQTVQGVRLVLRKAPLPSMVCPWSTKRHCGPLAFRRATEGSRVLRRVWGSQEGAREPYGALAPFCPCRWAPTSPPPDGGIPAGEHRHPRPPCLFFLRRLCSPLFAVKIEGSLFLYTNDERIEEAVL